MGSPGRLVGASLDRAVLSITLIKTAYKSPRGRPFGGGDVDHKSGYESINPYPDKLVKRVRYFF
jgi:hypothetical protein